LDCAVAVVVAAEAFVAAVLFAGQASAVAFVVVAFAVEAFVAVGHPSAFAG
jgi:hypothetical protein